MTLLGKNSNHIDENTKKDKAKDEYRLPVVVEQELNDMPFYKSFIYAVILHPLVIFLAWLLIFILSLLGINFVLFEKPKMPQRDIEFVLVDKEGTPIDKNTKYRSDRNSRAGGIHDPNRPVSIPQTAAPKGEANSPQPKAPAPKKVEPPKQKEQPKPKQQPKTQAPQPKAPQPKVQAPQPKAPEPKQDAPKTQAPKVAAPKVTQQAPKAPVVSDKPKSDFVIPVPKSEIPVVQPSTTAPIKTASGSGSGVNSGSASGSGSGSGAPAPSFSPTSGGSSGSGGGAGSKNGRFSGTSGTGSGNVGNPGPGNPNGAPGIDAIKEPDFGPYMRELQRRIKMNWDPPKGNESKRVILLFSISKDGRLLSIKVYKSSGLEAADNAAMTAVKLTAPFKPLPAEFKGQSVDIQFTFDYNVFGGSLH